MNQSEVRTIERSFIFLDPAGKTIRVVHEDRLAFAADAVTPIAFGPDFQSGLSHPMLIAIVDSEGAMKIPLPEGWGTWADAEVIERPHRRKAV